MDADRDYLLTELRKRDEVIARVAVIERRLERSNQGEDREIAEDLRAAVTAAKGDGE
jgi:Trp operon repressor